jgi:hypothetical protein
MRRSGTWMVAGLLIVVAAAAFVLGYYAMQRFIL